jgi:hypothetical protein
MRDLHDELAGKLKEMKRLAAVCAYADDDPAPQAELRAPCKLPAPLRAMNDYAYRVQLPVLKTQTAKPTGPTPDQVKDAIIDQYVRSVSRRRCARDIEDPGCLLESEILAMRKSLDKAEKQAPAAPGQLRLR